MDAVTSEEIERLVVKAEQMPGDQSAELWRLICRMEALRLAEKRRHIQAHSSE